MRLSTSLWYPRSVLTCAVVWLSPWPRNCLSNSKRDATGKGVTKVCSQLLHQRFDELSLLISENVCRCLETAILESVIHCEVRHWVKLDETGNQKWESVSPLRSTTDLIGRLNQR